jgi:DNA-binding NtrC family response regulator
LRPTILVVDDDPGLRESFRLILEDDYDVVDASGGHQALDIVRSTQVDVVLLDIRLPELDGIEVLERIKQIEEQVEVILVTAVKTVKTAVAAMKLGRLRLRHQAFEEDELLATIRRALQKRSLEREVVYLRTELARRSGLDDIVGQHAEMQKLFRTIAQIAATSSTVLISGESGTGKELVARAIHRMSPRRDKPFVAVNPAAISDTLVESELFGHEKGAFTGAYQRKPGPLRARAGRHPLPRRDRLAEAGDAGEAPARPAGARARARGRHADDPARRADRRGEQRRSAPGRGARGVPRRPLLPAERGAHQRAAAARAAVRRAPARRALHPALHHELGKRIAGLTPEAMAALQEYPWPGNVRELQNVLERAVALVESGPIGLNDLPTDVCSRPPPSREAGREPPAANRHR